MGIVANQTIINQTQNRTIYPHGRKDPPVIFWIFLSVETLLIISGNSLLIWLFLTNKVLRKLQNYFIVSLTVSSLLIGIGIFPCEYCIMLAETNEEKCKLSCGTIVSFTMIASVINLFLIAADRYFSIKMPFRYIVNITKRRALIVIFTGWFVAILLDLFPIFCWIKLTREMFNRVNVIYTCFLFGLTIIASLFLAISYYVIVKTVRETIRMGEPIIPIGVKAGMMGVASFFICWMPTCAVEILQQCGIEINSKIYDATYFILLLNHVLFPIMHLWYRRDFRRVAQAWHQKRYKAIRDEVAICLCNHRNQSSDMEVHLRSLILSDKTIKETKV